MKAAKLAWGAQIALLFSVAMFGLAACGSDDEEDGKQETPDYANCSMSVKDGIVMSDGYFANLEFSPNVEGYKEKYFLASEVKGKKDQELYNLVLAEENTYDPSKSSITFSNIMPAESEAFYCAIPYVTNNGEPDYGPMTKITFKTKSLTTSRDAMISWLYCNDVAWNFTITKNEDCKSYYLAMWGDDLAASLNYGQLSSAFVAAVLKSSIEEGRTAYTDDGPLHWYRNGTIRFIVYSWGMDGEGTLSNGMQKAYGYDEQYARNSKRKQVQEKGLGTSKKLTDAEFDALKKSLHVVKVAQ